MEALIIKPANKEDYGLLLAILAERDSKIVSEESIIKKLKR